MHYYYYYFLVRGGAVFFAAVSLAVLLLLYVLTFMSVNFNLLDLNVKDDILLRKVCQLEEDSYPVDEAASADTIYYRGSNANEYFKVFYETDALLGFVNGTCTSEPTILHESMFTHDPNGKTLVIHSVVVAASNRRRGIGKRMLLEYVNRITRECPRVDKILLLSKPELLKFYISCGFEVVGPSSVIHGKEQWFELQLNAVSFRRLKQLQIDAFANRPFAGNPAAVVVLPPTISKIGARFDEHWMQQLAMENNLAETAFITPLPSACNEYCIRWFTPAAEVDLCGHATLASAHALYSTGLVDRNLHINFHSLKSGILVAKSSLVSSYTLDFPSTPPVPIADPEDHAFVTDTLLQCFPDMRSNDVIFIGRTPYDVFIEVSPSFFAHQYSLAAAPIRFDRISELGGRGVVLTCVGEAARSTLPDSEASGFSQESIRSKEENSVVLDSNFHFLSRCFFPLYGINEDPVTGSAHCALAPYWTRKLPVLSSPLIGYQASRRGGVVKVECISNAVGDRVTLTGDCITTIESQLLV